MSRKLCDDCGRCPGVWDCLTEQVMLDFRSEVPLETLRWCSDVNLRVSRLEVLSSSSSGRLGVPLVDVPSIYWRDTLRAATSV